MTTTASSNILSSMAPAPRASAPGSRLGPDGDFPEDLTGLGMTELQVLHSRISCRLDHDCLADAAGPHFSTMDRCQELLTEPDTRDTA